MNQKDSAKQSMIEWLSHENELGKVPYKIECVDEFDLHDLHYYIFKFKKNRFSSWLVGVCGGYEADELEHCGHIWSHLKEYHEKTAKEECIEMVEMVREYWMNEAQKNQEPTPQNQFVDFVLLKDCHVDLMKVFDYLKQYVSFDKIEKNDEQIYVTKVGDSMITLSLMDIPVPNGEAQYYAQGCYMWKEAVEKVKEHQAHIIVSTMGKGISTIEAKLLQSQLIEACFQLEQAIAVYGDEMIWPKHIYCDVMKDYYQNKQLPIVLWIYLGLVTVEQGHSIYTLGLKNFGHYEIEVVPSQMSFSQLHEFIFNVVCYIIEQGAILKDGETIGMSETHKCLISFGQGLFLEENTLKIDVVEDLKA